MDIFIPWGGDAKAEDEGERLHNELTETGQAEKLPVWGKMWVRSGKVVCAIPDVRMLHASPTLFIDETLDKAQQVFALGGVCLDAFRAITVVTRYVQNLVVLAQAHPALWPHCFAPPRLHLRELTSHQARLKTRWRHVPLHDLALLFRTFVADLREHANFKLICPVELERMTRNIAVAFRANQAKQLSLQLASIILRTLLTEARGAAEQLEIVADYDHSKVQVGIGRRQATLHVIDSFFRGEIHVPLNFEVLWDRTARYSSNYPENFSLAILECEGFSIRKLVECVGLQFIDVYLGLWRLMRADQKSHFGIKPSELGVHMTTTVDWPR